MPNRLASRVRTTNPIDMEFQFGVCRQRWLAWFVKEPFVHFVALGVLIFAVYALLNPNTTSAEHRIEVTAEDLGRLRALAVKQWGRAPDARQMDELVQSFVREEVLYRTAIANGLDRDDVIVRRRLAQKMEFLANDQVRGPDENELQRYFAAHAKEYLRPATADFEQIYFSTDRRGASVNTDARQALENLKRGKPARGDNFMLEGIRVAQEREAIARDFGDAFADSVFSRPVDAWFGPIRSAHGLHLLRITQRKPEATGRFEAVRDKVAADMVNARVAAARDAAYARLLERYTVVLPTNEILLSGMPKQLATR